MSSYFARHFAFSPLMPVMLLMPFPRRLSSIIVSGLIVATLVALAPQAHAARRLPAPVAAALKAADIPPEALGIHVQEVSAGKPMLAFHADAAFSPASTMKLVTTNAALELLGPTFRWGTEAYFHGTLAGDVLHGDLILKGSGDPKLVLENFWLFLRQIRGYGIRDIRGDLVLDRSAFAEVAHDPALFDGEAMRPYNAGADALLLNYASFRFRFVPDPLLGNVTVRMDPPFAGPPLVAPRLVRDEDGCVDWQRKLGASFAQGIAFTGTYAAACGERTWSVFPHQVTPDQYVGSTFMQMWTDLGGSFQGQVRSGTLPAGAARIAEWQSVALPEIIRDINKFSNNVMARQVLLTIAAYKGTPPANAAAGAQAVRQWLASKGIAAPELVLENGSGLSRAERIAPRTLGRMLVAAFQSPLMPEFMASMPLAGLDGTMRGRMWNKGVAGSAHIKTGSLKDVRAIAGYVLAASGKRYAVVGIINHANAAAGAGVHDALLQWIYEKG